VAPKNDVPYAESNLTPTQSVKPQVAEHVASQPEPKPEPKPEPVVSTPPVVASSPAPAAPTPQPEIPSQEPPVRESRIDLASALQLKLDAKHSADQDELSFNKTPRGRFEGENPNVLDGEDLDLPPFLRKKKP
jgi:cell division protein FtsZ